jgi:hypothetical protein
MSTNVTDETMEAIARDTGLTTAELEEVQAELEAAISGFQGPSEITSFAGLAGLYLWPENGTPQTMNFTFNAGSVEEGTYLLSNLLTGALEKGDFTASTAPPSLKSITLRPNGGIPRAFAVLSMFINPATGKIQNMQLRKLFPSLFRVFSAVRMV